MLPVLRTVLTGLAWVSFCVACAAVFLAMTVGKL